MKNRAFIRTLWAMVLLFLLASCVPGPASPTATPTPRPKTATPAPTATPLPTKTVPPSPTLPDKVQLSGEIALRPLPDIGHNPQAIAVLGGRVYVANRGTDNVSVIEGGKVSAAIPVGAAPIALAADEKTELVYVANEGDNSISFISGNRVVRTVPAPKSPACLVALDGRLYAGGRGENALAVLDGVSGERVATVPLSASIGVLALAVNPVTHLLYASVYNSVQVVDLRSLTPVAVLTQPVYVTLGADPSSERVFVNEYDADTNTQYLVAYDGREQKELGRVAIGGDPRGMAVDPASGRIYVANSWTNDVSVIEASSLRLIATIPVGLRPLAVAVGKDQVYVVNSDSDNVAIIDSQSNRLLRVVPLSLLPSGMAVHPATGRLYVACASTNSVFVMNDGPAAAEIPVGLHPADVALSMDGDQLFVLNHVSGDLSVISTQDNRIVKTVDIGDLPQGLMVAPQTGQLYVSDTVLDVGSQRLLRRTELLTMYRSLVKPVHMQVDVKAGRAFMVASNGVPGSNSGLIIYVVDLKSGELIKGAVGGLSTTALALDPDGQRVFSTAGRFGHFQLIVNDALSLKQTDVVDLPHYPAALAYNPQTHHVFICLNPAPDPAGQARPELWVLDSRGWGTVARFSLPDQRGWNLDPYDLAVDATRGYVYIADRQVGTVHVLRDATLPPPPSPTPTYTPTPWPTLTLEPQASPTTAAQVEPSCARTPSPRFNAYWAGDKGLRLGLGCPTRTLQSGSMVEQPYERGHMVWREADRAVLVLYGDGVWRSFPDRWREGMPELGCEVAAPGGLQQPKRGFGLVWCAEKGVKEGLGWATEEEHGYTSEWQDFERGQMVLSTGRSVVYALLNDGTFHEYPAR